MVLLYTYFERGPEKLSGKILLNGYGTKTKGTYIDVTRSRQKRRVIQARCGDPDASGKSLRLLSYVLVSLHIVFASLQPSNALLDRGQVRREGRQINQFDPYIGTHLRNPTRSGETIHYL